MGKKRGHKVGGGKHRLDTLPKVLTKTKLFSGPDQTGNPNTGVPNKTFEKKTNISNRKTKKKHTKRKRQTKKPANQGRGKKGDKTNLKKGNKISETWRGGKQTGTPFLVGFWGGAAPMGTGGV